MLRPAAVACVDVRRGRDLDRCTLSIPSGARLLVVSDPDASASALLRILAGLSRADHGEIRIAGSADHSAAGWGRRVAYLGPEPGLYASMSPLEALSLAGRLAGLSAAEIARRSERAIAWARIPAASLDRPMARGGAALLERTGLAVALIGNPEVLLLDEPLRAIDATERDRLLSLPGRRLTIMIASRYPASESGLVSHVAYLRRGRVEIIAPVAALANAGLTLTHRGLEALIRMRAASALARTSAPA